MTTMTQLHIDHKEISDFAADRVNLSAEDAKQNREQVDGLISRLENHIKEHPEFDLVRMFHSGSVAKGTALRNVSDMDAAVYIRKGKAPESGTDLIQWMVARLREANPNMKQEQFTPQDFSVGVNFSGSGLDVDVVPVIYEGAKDWLGHLVQRRTGVRVLTSIPRHIDFIKRRKATNPTDFAQVVRLVKWWVQLQEQQREGFKFKSLMVEMLVAHLVETVRLPLTNYRETLELIFMHILKTKLQNPIWFSDYYKADALPPNDQSLMKFYDPINPKNNVASSYTDVEHDLIMEAAREAFDALTWARQAPTKGLAVDCWKKVLGPGIGGA